MKSEHQICIAGTSVIQNVLTDTSHLYANHCQINVAHKKLKSHKNGEMKPNISSKIK